MSSTTINQTLQIADSCLILAQRNGEWCGHGPILEQDIAITNITLDLVGQARNFYQYAAKLMNESNGSNETEDSLAYLRGERDFKNYLICEQPKGDWAVTILRQFLFSSFQQLLFKQLISVDDKQIQAIAAKSLKEIAYHTKWSGEWVIRLGDGTDESRERMKNALDILWMYTDEFFKQESYELINVANLKAEWLKDVSEVLQEATLLVPENVFMQHGGKKGLHTEHLGYILAEMQYLQRVYPGAEW